MPIAERKKEGEVKDHHLQALYSMIIALMLHRGTGGSTGTLGLLLFGSQPIFLCDTKLYIFTRPLSGITNAAR